MPDRNNPLRSIRSFTLIIALSISANADVFNLPAGQTSLQMVAVGNPGNPNDPATGLGRVIYNYSIGKFEVTIGQYVEFLNAIAATDTYGLYNDQMTLNLNSAGVSRSGSPGTYAYTAIGSPNKPIDLVRWGDAARFCNWLANGQPTGAQGPGTTETGSYALNGATTESALAAVNRTAGARYYVPTGNEWYKAAFYDPTKGGSNYWLYPMRTDAVPNSAMPPGTVAPNPARTGNFYRDDGVANGFDDGIAVTGTTSYSLSQNYLSEVGAYTFAASYYGTFDQGGNVGEWSSDTLGSQRGNWGGGWTSPANGLRSTNIVYVGGGVSSFRIVLLPEPATLALFGLAAVALSRRRKANGV